METPLKNATITPFTLISGCLKTRFISPLGEICIDEVNKGLRSNQTEISAKPKYF